MTSSSHFLKQLFTVAETQAQKLALVLDDQSWTYGELIDKVKSVVRQLHKSKIVQGQIIFQFVERGFDMICGLLAIMCVGGVYCAISPAEPANRLARFLEQIQGQYVLVHRKTHHRFPPRTVKNVLILDDILLQVSCVTSTDDSLLYRDYGAAFIIPTSGTTGRPKLVVHTHKSLSAMVATYTQWNGGICRNGDQNLQSASCSWILHLWEITSTLTIGGTLILLRPNGHLDMSYFSKTLFCQQVTALSTGPATIRALTHYLKESQRLETLRFMRNITTGGNERFPISRISLLDNSFLFR